MKRAKSLLIKSWKGEASLAQAFWLVFFLFGILLAVIVSILLAIIFPYFNYPFYTNVIAAILFPYTVFSAICVWRCSIKSSLIWMLLARLIVVLAVILGITHIWHLITPPPPAND